MIILYTLRINLSPLHVESIQRDVRLACTLPVRHDGRVLEVRLVHYTTHCTTWCTDL